MKLFLFSRKSNNFDDIIKDNTIKPVTLYKMQYHEHILLGIYPDKDRVEKVESYIVLKYGDDLLDLNQVIPDRSPIIDKDYTPLPRDKNETS